MMRLRKNAGSAMRESSYGHGDPGAAGEYMPSYADAGGFSPSWDFSARQDAWPSDIQSLPFPFPFRFPFERASHPIAALSDT